MKYYTSQLISGTTQENIRNHTPNKILVFKTKEEAKCSAGSDPIYKITFDGVKGRSQPKANKKAGSYIVDLVQVKNLKFNPIRVTFSDDQVVEPSSSDESEADGLLPISNVKNEENTSLKVELSKETSNTPVEPIVESASFNKETVGEALAKTADETISEAVAETISEAVAETISEAVAETADEAIGEAVAETDETIGEAVAEVDETIAEAVAETVGETEANHFADLVMIDPLLNDNTEATASNSKETPAVDAQVAVQTVEEIRLEHDRNQRFMQKLEEVRLNTQHQNQRRKTIKEITYVLTGTVAGTLYLIYGLTPSMEALSSLMSDTIINALPSLPSSLPLNILASITVVGSVCAFAVGTVIGTASLSSLAFQKVKALWDHFSYTSAERSQQLVAVHNQILHTFAENFTEANPLLDRLNSYIQPVTEQPTSCVENEVKLTEAEAAIWQTHQVKKIFNNQRTVEASLEKLENKLNTPMSEAKILNWKEKSKKYA